MQNQLKYALLSWFLLISIGQTLAQVPQEIVEANKAAIAYYQQGNFPMAIQKMEEATQLYARKVSDSDANYGALINNLAEMYRNQGDTEKAMPLFLQAKNIWSQTIGKEHPAYATVCNNLAGVYRDQGRYTSAEPLLVEAKTIQTKTVGTNHPDYALTCNNLGALYKQEGRYAEAEKLLLEAKNIRAKAVGTNHPDYALTCNNLAELYRAKNQTDTAKKYYQEALNIYKNILGTQHPTYAKALNGWASLHYELQQYEQANTLYQEVKNIREEHLGKNHPDYAKACDNLANSFAALQQYSQADALYQEAKTIIETKLGKNHPEYAKVCNNWAVLYTKQKRYKEAHTLYKELIQQKTNEIIVLLPTLSEAERKEYLTSIQSFWENFQIFALQYYPEYPAIAADLLNLQLLIKGLIFESTLNMQKQILESNNPALIEKYKTWKLKKQQLNQYTLLAESPEKAQLQTELNLLEKELSAQANLFGKMLQNRQYTWTDIQKQLSPDEAALEIVRIINIDKIVYAALIIKPNNSLPELVVFENGKTMETKDLAIYRNLIENGIKTAPSYQSYWQPLQATLQAYKKVYVCPDGVYFSLNLNTLYQNETQQYIIETKDILLVNNLKDVILSKTETTSIFSQNASAVWLCLMGYPDYAPLTQTATTAAKDYTILPLLEQYQEKDTTQNRFLDASGSIKVLKGTEQELNNIANIAEKEQISHTINTGKNASEEVLKIIKSPTVLHIATHGYFINNSKQNQPLSLLLQLGATNNPLFRSGLLLANAEASLKGNNTNTEDGILNAEEVLSLHLENTALVVLSACETGLGEISLGEGVYGLQRSFRQAGAQCVVISLWKVNDQTTQEFMTLFYELLLQQRLPHREAFAKAQIALKQKYPSAKYWGAFMMIGE